MKAFVRYNESAKREIILTKKGKQELEKREEAIKLQINKTTKKDAEE